jgi:hypothetical protein
MRAAGLIVSAIVLLTALPGVAHASAPIPGGRYVDRIHAHGTIGRIKLTLANDGLEFAAPSIAEFRVRRCWLYAALSDDPLGNGAVAVGGDGRFRHTERSGTVRGRFIRRGRLAVGRVKLAPNDFGCRGVSVRFRARLTGTPNATQPGLPSSCDRVTISELYVDGYDRYAVYEQGIGCTAARRLARRWHTSRDCAVLTTAGEMCSLGVATCERIPQGIWQPLARIRCSTPERPGGATELVYERACGWPPSDGFVLSAINLDCGTARTFPSEQMLEIDGPCGNLKRLADDHAVTCAPIAGYVCTVRVEIKGIDFNARCVEQQTGLVAVVLSYSSPD